MLKIVLSLLFIYPLFMQSMVSDRNQPPRSPQYRFIHSYTAQPSHIVNGKNTPGPNICVRNSLIDQAPSNLEILFRRQLNMLNPGALLLFFSGESGSGKTETARALAEKYSIPWYSHSGYMDKRQLGLLLVQFKDIHTPEVLIIESLPAYFHIDPIIRKPSKRTKKPRNPFEEFREALAQVDHNQNLIIIGTSGLRNEQLPPEIKPLFTHYEFSNQRTPQRTWDIFFAYLPPNTEFDVNAKYLEDLASKMKNESGFKLKQLIDLAVDSMEKRMRSEQLAASNPNRDIIIRENIITREDLEAAYQLLFPTKKRSSSRSAS